MLARDGDAAAAQRTVERFLAGPAGQPLAHHIGLRLIAQAALDDGWGDPSPWLREAEPYFHAVPAPPAAAACRALLRRAGVRVPQRRGGAAAIPPRLRTAGVTVREYEVLELVAASLGNREIAKTLFLSPRTVEKHVSNLLAKTGERDRSGLARHGAGRQPRGR
jgi:DNA-binding CsgD family transcriptional regulator